MSLIMVDDPDYKGKLQPGSPGIPQVPRSWAMRKLFAQGISIGDIARRYEVIYVVAYKAINPPRQPATSPTSKAAKPLTRERLSSLPRSKLILIASTKARIKVRADGEVTIRDNPAYDEKRVQAAVDELDSRFPDWNG